MERDRGDARLGDEALASSTPERSPGSIARAQLHRDRQARALRGGRGPPRPPIAGSREQRRAGAGLEHLRHRAAHVEVDQVGPGRRGDRRRLAHHLGVGAEELQRDRVLVGMDPQHLLGCAVAVVRARSSRPSPRPRARRRGDAPAGARTSCRSRPAARAGRGWRSRPPIRNGVVSAALSIGLNLLTRRRSCAPRSAADRSGSGGRRSRRSSRSSGAIAFARPAGGDERSARRRARARSAARSRRSARRSRRSTPDWIAARVDLPIADSGSARSILGIRGAALGERAQRDLDPGRDRAAEVLAVGGDGVEVDRGAEVDDDAGTAEPVVGGDRVDEPVGADLVAGCRSGSASRSSPRDRSAGTGRRSSAPPSPCTRCRAAARPRRPRAPSISLGSIRSSASRPAIARRARRAVASALGSESASARRAPSPSKPPMWVCVLPTSIASSIRRQDRRRRARRMRHEGNALRDSRLPSRAGPRG